MQQALSVPMADQFDDWREYLRLKSIDRGKDFTFLREIVSSPLTGLGEEAGTKDNGYFSRRGSQADTKCVETANKEGEKDNSRRASFKFTGGRDKYDMRGLEYKEEDDDVDEDAGYSSRRGSRGTRKSSVAATPTLKAVAEEEEEEEEDPGYFSRQNSTVSANIDSLPVLERVGPSDAVVKPTKDDELTPTAL